MNTVIQMMMLIAGAVMLMVCKVNASAISGGAVFKAGMVAIFSVFGVAWMSDTFSGTSERTENGAGRGREKPSVDLRYRAVPRLETGKQPCRRTDRRCANGSDAGR